MKKELLTLFSIMLAAVSVSAQKPDSAQAMVHYKFTWIRDTTRRDTPYTENMILFVGQNASAYKSYDRKMQNDLMRKQMAEQMAASGGTGNFRFKSSGKGGSSSTEFYQFPNENKLVRKESLLMSSYLIEEPFPTVKWKISGDTSTIGNLHCQKATAHFRGRDYTAWFCPELPYRSGPWKLSGLPGLIIEAYDAKKDVVFKFDGIEPVVKSPKPADPMSNAPAGMHAVLLGGDDASADPNLIVPPSNGVKTTEAEFKNLQEAMRKDPNAFAQSMMAGSGMGMKPDNNVSIRINPGPIIIINNPLELPEKK